MSTFREVGRAVNEGRWTDASELANYFVDEALVCWNLYRRWIVELEEFLVDSGAGPDEVAEIRAGIADVTRMPDGTLFDPDQEWADFRELITKVNAATAHEDASGALKLMELAKETWRRTTIATSIPSTATAPRSRPAPGRRRNTRHVADNSAAVVDDRYTRFDIDTFEWGESLDVLMYVTFEAMRGHLVGPERTGDIEFEEFDDRYVVSFDPCGSGGRTVQGDDLEGTGPRMEAPYNWKVSEEPHDWNHYTPGVCLYCAHCIVLTEQMPMDRFGYPVRVVDPPVYEPNQAERQRCRWTMYKDPTAVPEELYTRAGRTKPTTFGSAGNGGQKVFLGSISMPGEE